MHETDESSPDQPSADESYSGESALQSAQSYIARSPSTSGESNNRGKTFTSTFKALLEWGEEHELIRAESDFACFQRPRDSCGHEHECWFDESSNRWLKATYPNRFGLAWGSGTATADGYLTRLTLQNKYFADDIHLVALVQCNSRLRVLISQPHIAGDPATSEEIKLWFCRVGFVRLEDECGIAWYNKESNLLIADAHEGNIIRSQQGELVPIDLNIVQPDGPLLEWVLRKISVQPATKPN